MMTAVAGGQASDPDVVGCEALPVDLEGITDSVDRALAITLCMPDRQEIDSMANRLRGALNLFLAEDLGFSTNQEARQMSSSAHRLLELTSRPDAETPQFTAFEYMRELARVTRYFVGLWQERHPSGGHDG
ncbi:DUF6415 family natural product biosynthesis protein [Streptomyces sp. NPDC004980]